jgi:hypothetical protein
MHAQPSTTSTSEVLPSLHQTLTSFNDDSTISEMSVLHTGLCLATAASPDLLAVDNDNVSELAASLGNLRSSWPIQDLDEAWECTGTLVQWTPGSVWDTYPYHQHGIRSLSWEPIGFDGNNKWLRLRSRNCCIILSADALSSLCCRECTAIPHSSEYRTFVNRATHAADNTPYSFLTQKQIHRLLLKVTGQYRQLVMKVSNCYSLTISVLNIVPESKCEQETHFRTEAN